MTKLVFENAHGRKAVTELGELLGEGVAGRIYAVRNATNVVAKLYKDKTDLLHYSKKIRAMVQAPPNLPPFQFHSRTYVQIAWPLGPLSSMTGEFLGFLMPEIDMKAATELENILQKKQRKRKGLPEFYDGRVLLATNLAALMAELHSLGHFMIDMKPANIRFYPHSWYLAILDTDGFSVSGPERLAAEHFTDEYIAPEAANKKPSELGLEQDLFALAIIIFRLLNNGLHPYQGVDAVGGLPSTHQARIFDHLYPYGLTASAKVKPSLASIHDYFERDTRELFDRAFMTQDRRPSAEEWRAHLAVLISGGRLVKCTKHSDEHAHFSKGCGLCAAESKFSGLRSATVQPPIQIRAPAVTTMSSPWGRAGLALSSSTPAQVTTSPPPPPRRQGLSARTLFYGAIGLAVLVLAMTSRKDPSPVLPAPAPDAKLQAVPAPIPVPRPDSAAEPAARREQELEEQRRQAHNRLRVTISNSFSSDLLLSFYSTDKTKAWPGGDEFYVLRSGEDRRFSLNCTNGESICYAAWVKGERFGPFWGTGYKGRHNCSSCCLTCGSETSMPIVMSKSDSYRVPGNITFRIMSQLPFSILVAFYTRNGRSGWPGGDRDNYVSGYQIQDGSVHSYPLNCRVGEKICFGAWENGNPYGRYWGCGPRCSRGCSKCCYTCDGDETKIINLTGSHGLE